MSSYQSSQQQPLRINSDLLKKIKSILELSSQKSNQSPMIDEEKMIEMIQSDQTIRLKKQIIKSGVVQYYRRFLTNGASKDENTTKKNGKSSNDDSVLENLKKKLKKNEQRTYQFEDNPEKYLFEMLGGVQSLKIQVEDTLFQFVTHRKIYRQVSVSRPNCGFLICGSVGSGKTSIANCILSRLQNEHKYSCYFINALELSGGDSEEKIKKIFESMEQKQPSALCIDNIQQLCSKQSNKKLQGSGASALNTLSIQIDKSLQKQYIFLATSSNPEKLDILTKPGRFYRSFKLVNPGEVQKLEILNKIISNYQTDLSHEQKQEIIKLTSGFVPIDIVSLVQEAHNKSVKRFLTQSVTEVIEQVSDKAQQKFDSQELKIEFSDFQNAVKQVQPVLKREGFAKIPTTKLSDIGALQNIKQSLINEIILPMKSKEKFKKMNFQVNGGGVLLYGPPGCGKTMLAKGIANQANVNFITVKGPQLLTKYVGQSEEAVRKVFDRARLSSPSVIFFDQFDALAPKRNDQGNQVTERVVNTLLNELNGLDDRNMVFVIAATNRPDIIDEAVLRSGRIQLKLEVPMPSLKDREKIIQKVTSNVAKLGSIDVEGIAVKTEGFSGADLNYLVKKAIISAVSNDREGITTQDLQKALEEFQRDKLFSKKKGTNEQSIIEREEYLQKIEDLKQYQFRDDEGNNFRDNRKMQQEDQEAVQGFKQSKSRSNQNVDGGEVLNEFINFMVKKQQANKRSH